MVFGDGHDLGRRFRRREHTGTGQVGCRMQQKSGIHQRPTGQYVAFNFLQQRRRVGGQHQIDAVYGSLGKQTIQSLLNIAESPSDNEDHRHAGRRCGVIGVWGVCYHGADRRRSFETTFGLANSELKCF